jgi:hypothetical protein
MHSPAAFDPVTGLPTGPPSVGWTSVFADELVKIGAVREDVVAITAAMLGPTGLAPFAEAFPERCVDVGIAEQHAFTSAAGLAYAGLHPVVAVYSTFLNRAFDQLLMDVALHRQAVTLVLDRAGVTGNDGPSHNGMWDLSLLGIVPGMRVAAPRDAATLREELAEAVAVDDGPTALRFPKGAVIDAVPAVRRVDGVDVLHEGGGSEVLLVCAGRSGSWAWPRRTGWRARGWRSRSSTRGGCCRCPMPSSRWRASTGSWSRSPTRAARRLRLRAGRRPARGGVRRARARPGDPPGVPRPRQPGRRAGRRRAGGAGRRPADHRVGGCAAPGARGAQLLRGDTLMRVLVVEDEAALADAVAAGCGGRGWPSTSPTTATPATRRRASPGTTWWCSTATCPACAATTCARRSSPPEPPRACSCSPRAARWPTRSTACPAAPTTTSPSPSTSPSSVARCRALGRRATPAAPPMLTADDVVLDPARRTVSRAGRSLDLTRKEFGVLEVLLAARGAVVSSEELLERVWDENADPFTTTVRVTVMTLRKKLGEPGVIDTVVGAGYRVPAAG